MKLFTRFFISHTAPVLVLTFALAFVGAALLRIALVLTTLRAGELETLHDEGTLHKSAWALDVAMRHAQLACARRHGDADAVSRVRVRSEALASVLRESTEMPSPMHALSLRYLATAGDVLTGDACATLLGAEHQEARSRLDEQLTNVWVDRLAELHRAVTAREDEARSVAVVSAYVGAPLAISSFLLALLIARRMAHGLERPLAALAGLAHRFGSGDFRTPVQVEGPAEVLALADSLERMRSQLEQLETLKQGFLASVSHELRTPLSKIREALALLSDGAVGPLDEKQARVVQIARTACEREIRMVTTLLDLSRLRSGSPVHLRDGSSLDGVLHAAVEDERGEAVARGVEVDLVMEGESRLCRLDPVLVERAVANLVRNAVSVSRRGQRVRVERAVEPRSRPGAEHWVRITVSDQGPGVPRDVRDAVFDAFVTRPVPSTGKALGVGIGLALTREIARAHGGEVELLDTASGATFAMWLPAEERVPESSVRRSSRTPSHDTRNEP